MKAHKITRMLNQIQNKSENLVKSFFKANGWLNFLKLILFF